MIFLATSICYSWIKVYSNSNNTNLLLSLNLLCEKDNNYGYSSFDVEYYSGERISGNINMQTN